MISQNDPKKQLSERSMRRREDRPSRGQSSSSLPLGCHILQIVVGSTEDKSSARSPSLIYRGAPSSSRMICRGEVQSQSSTKTLEGEQCCQTIASSRPRKVMTCRVAAQNSTLITRRGNESSTAEMEDEFWQQFFSSRGEVKPRSSTEALEAECRRRINGSSRLREVMTRRAARSSSRMTRRGDEQLWSGTAALEDECRRQIGSSRCLKIRRRSHDRVKPLRALRQFFHQMM